MEEQEKLILKKEPNCDTRTAEDNITKKQLLQATYSHINDVNTVGNWLADKFKEDIKNHDHTKVDYIDDFYRDFVTRAKDIEFKSLPWWQIHKTERHHLNDSVPEDVNLLDILEMIVDCTCAGLTRSGKVYPITVPEEVVKKAIQNTSQLIIDNVEVQDKE